MASPRNRGLIISRTRKQGEAAWSLESSGIKEMYSPALKGLREQPLTGNQATGERSIVHLVHAAARATRLQDAGGQLARLDMRFKPRHLSGNARTVFGIDADSAVVHNLPVNDLRGRTRRGKTARHLGNIPE